MRRFCTPGRIVVACKGCIYKSLFSSASSAAYCAAHDSIRRLGPRLRAHLVRVRKRAAEQHAHKRGLARTFKQNLGHAHLHGCADLMLMRDLCVDPHHVESVVACYERVCASRHRAAPRSHVYCTFVDSVLLCACHTTYRLAKALCALGLGDACQIHVSSGSACAYRDFVQSTAHKHSRDATSVAHEWRNRSYERRNLVPLHSYALYVRTRR